MLGLSLNRSLCPGGEMSMEAPAPTQLCSLGWPRGLGMVPGTPLAVTNHGPASGKPPPPDTTQSQTVNGSIFLRIKGRGFFV